MRGKKPTLKQKKFLTNKKLVHQNWLVLRDTPEFIEFLNRKSGKIRRFEKSEQI